MGHGGKTEEALRCLSGGCSGLNRTGESLWEKNLVAGDLQRIVI